MTTLAAPDRASGSPLPARLAEALRAICAAVGLDAEGAQLLRFVNNGVIRLAHDPVVVRIVLTSELAHRTETVVTAARWLAEHDAPAIRLLDGVDAPLRVGDHLATLWHHVPDVGPEPSSGDLAELLARMHRLPDPPATLSSWRPLDDVRARLTAAEELGELDRRFFVERCEALQVAVDELDFPLPIGFVHGDAHLGNVIAGPDGPVLCDFDSSCLGPPEWDLTPLAVGQVRFGHLPQVYRDFADRYGFDVMSWDGFDVLREIRELKLTAAVLPVLRSNPEVRDEFAHRLRTFRAGDRLARWAPHR